VIEEKENKEAVVISDTSSIGNEDKLTKYQKYHLRIMIAALALSFFTVCILLKQVNNLSQQTKRNTEMISLQKRATEAQTWYGIVQQMVVVDKVFIDNPEVYPYFFESIKPPNDKRLHAKVKSTAIMVLDFMDGFEDDYIRQLPEMGENGKNWIAWERYFTDQFASSPVLCDSYNEISTWYVKNGVVANAATKGCSQAQQVSSAAKKEK
jgi:hypothetical protein